jgi:hypothetical protein
VSDNLGRSVAGAKRPCLVGDGGYGSDHIISRVLVEIRNRGVTRTVTIVIGGRDDVDAVWVRGGDTNSTSVGDGWGDGEEGRRRN